MARTTVVPTVVIVALIGVGLALTPRTTHSAAEQVIRMTAKKFEYSPDVITVKKGVPVVLEIMSLDRDHGFKLREFGVRADINRERPRASSSCRTRADVFHFSVTCSAAAGTRT